MEAFIKETYPVQRSTTVRNKWVHHILSDFCWIKLVLSGNEELGFRRPALMKTCNWVQRSLKPWEGFTRIIRGMEFVILVPHWVWLYFPRIMHIFQNAAWWKGILYLLYFSTKVRIILGTQCSVTKNFCDSTFCSSDQQHDMFLDCFVFITFNY